MTFEEYIAAERPRYKRLAEIVESILTIAIAGRPGLRLQHKQNRAKEADSLERKLKRDGHFEATDIELRAKDLAGCRLVFYTNSDVSAFLSSRIIADNFDIDWDRTKIHHPNADTDSAADHFVSNNYVVRLKPERAALVEYASVAGLWCEVQVQTTLNHAWAEMAHNTIYKKPELPGGFGASLMEQIEKRMREIMRDHLLPAGYEFQKVLSDFERLSAGKELFDRGALEAFSECDDNNARFELLQRFSTYVLPHYDDIAGVAAEIRATLRDVITAARTTTLKPIETPFGNLPGHSVAEVVDQAANIIDNLRYVDVRGSFDFLIEMFASATEEDERSRWTKSAEELAQHQIPAWEKVGPAVQLTLLARLKTLPKNLKQSARPLLVAVLRKSLETEVTGTTAEFDKIVFSRGTIPYSDAVQKMRREAIRLLKLFVLIAATDQERRDAISALHEGTRFAGSPREKFQIEVLENSRDIVQFYAQIADQLSYETLESLEHRVLWLHRYAAKPATSDAEPSIIEDARLRLRESIKAFRETINADQRFVTYKTLVGYESVFPPAWDDDEFDIGGIDEYRSKRIDEFVATISDENADDWVTTIRLCASTQSADLATFPKFGEFLEKLAQAKPELAFRILKDDEDLLANFLPSISRGLEATPTYKRLRALMRKWVAKGKFLSPIVWTFRSTKAVDVQLLTEAMAQAVASDDRQALLNLVTVADLRNADVTDGLVDKLMIPAVNALSASGDHRWPNAVWGRRQNSSFSSLSDAQVEEVLGALVAVPRLGWREEEILSAIAISKPILVIDFFGQRLAARETISGYSPIPFQFHHLHEELIKEAPYAVVAAHRWFESDPDLFSYRGGRFVANVFAGAWALLEPELRKFVEADGKDLKFVVQVLRTFEGEEFLHPLIKDVIARLNPESDLLGEIEIALDESGVVSGEFGFVDLYKQRREQMIGWLDDDRPHVREFAERKIRSLERMIAAEQRRAEEDYELRKRNWGIPENDPDKKEG